MASNRGYALDDRSLFYDLDAPRTGSAPSGLGITTEWNYGVSKEEGRTAGGYLTEPAATHGQYRWKPDTYRDKRSGREQESKGQWEVYSDMGGWTTYSPDGWEATQRQRGPMDFAPGGKYGPPRTERQATPQAFFAGSAKIDWNPLAKRKR